MVQPDDVRFEEEKRRAAEAAVSLVRTGMLVGLGTGSTVAYFLPALARRRLDITCVATSEATLTAAQRLGLRVVDFDGLDHLDIAIDGGDRVDPSGWLVKGEGGAHSREKIVATAAERFVVIVSSNKVVDELAGPVPLELLTFGLGATLREIGDVRIRPLPPSPDGGVLAHYFGPLDNPRELSRRLDAIPGVVSHGLFGPEVVNLVLIGRGGDVCTRGPELRH